MKNFKPILITSMLATLMISGYFAVSAEYGSKDDPLVSLSYIKEIILPQTEAMIEEKLANSNSNINISEVLDSLDTNYLTLVSDETFIDSVSKNVSPVTSSVLNLSSEQTLHLSTGSEVLLRTGGLTMTSGSALNATTAENAGATIAIDNLYITTANDTTMKSSANTTVIVFGKYELK